MAFHNYISYYLFFILFVHPFFGVETVTPLGRLGHSAVLIENKLYFFGGEINFYVCLNDVLYLDVSQRSPPFFNVTGSEGMPFKGCWGTFLLSEVNNEQPIFLFSGYTYDLVTNNDSFTSLVYTFDPKSGEWNTPVIVGDAPQRRMRIQSVIDDLGNAYIFGGRTDNKIGTGTFNFNDMIILHTKNLTWSYGSIIDAPSRRHSYTATLLSNGLIVYIGGHETTADNIDQEVDINQINIYDTKLSAWSVMVCIYGYYYKLLYKKFN